MKKYAIILLIITGYLNASEQPLFEPTLTDLPLEIREKIISHLPDEEQLFARLTLQQVNKQLRDELNKLKNGTIEKFDAFLNKTAKQLGPIPLENIISHLTNLQNGKSFQLNQNIALELNQIWDTVGFLKKAQIKEIEIPPFLLASLFYEWPAAKKWLHTKHVDIRTIFLMNTQQDQLTTYAIQLYFFASILGNGSLITKKQLIPLPASAIRRTISYYVFLTGTIYSKRLTTNIRISPLFTTLIEIIYKINNIPAQEGIVKPNLYVQLNNDIENKQEPEKTIYKNLKEHITKMLFTDFFYTSQKFTAEIAKIPQYKNDHFLRAHVNNFNNLISKIYQNRCLDDFYNLERYAKHILNKLPQQDVPYIYNLWQTITLIGKNILYLENPTQQATKRPAQEQPEEQPEAKKQRTE
ncbi:MAG: F-box protein [Candidatus Dependentiae bacterium]